MKNGYQTSAIAGVVGVLAILTMLVLGLSAIGQLNSDSVALLTTIVGFGGTIIVSLLAVVRTDRSVALIQKTNGDVGDMKESVKALEHKTVDMPVVPPSHSEEANG